MTLGNNLFNARKRSGLSQEKVEIDSYAASISELLDSLKTRYGYNDLDAMLVLKDILSHVWNVKNSNPA